MVLRDAVGDAVHTLPTRTALLQFVPAATILAGTVYKCQHRETGSIVAIKQMKDENANEHVGGSALAPDTEATSAAAELQITRLICPMVLPVQLRKTAIREAKILRQLQHPNVVRLLELFRSKTSLYMVFEFMNRSILNVLVSATETRSLLSTPRKVQKPAGLVLLSAFDACSVPGVSTGEESKGLVYD